MFTLDLRILCFVSKEFVFQSNAFGVRSVPKRKTNGARADSHSMYFGIEHRDLYKYTARRHRLLLCMQDAWLYASLGKACFMGLSKMLFASHCREYRILNIA